MVKGSDVARESISFNFDRLSLALPTLAPNTGGSLVLGWYGCITCTLAATSAAPSAAVVDYTANVKITVPGDVDTTNNEASATARGLLSSPMVGAFMDYTDDACMDRVLYGPVATNKSSIELRGKAAPNRIIAILIGLQQFATVTSDAGGSFSYTITLPPGVHRIHAEYADQVGQFGATAVAINSPRDIASGLPTGQVVIKVDPTLPFDPMSTCFVDSKGRSYAVPTLGYSFGATQTGTWLRSGETYAISVNASGGDLNAYYKVTFEDVLISSLLDADGDGNYQGTAVFPALLTAASTDALAASGTLGLIAGSSTGENSYSVEVGTAADGVISSRATGQPVGNASVSALLAQGTSDGSLVYSTTANQPGEPNPQVTGADGRYSYSMHSGIYRLDVAAPGYQPYRSGDIDAGQTPLAQNIALAPAIAEAAAKTIYITANGYLPAAADVAPGSVVEFVNLDFADHSSTGSGWDSGMLATGQSFKVKFAGVGSFSYGDDADPLFQGGITVVEGAGIDEHLYLPMVRR